MKATILTLVLLTALPILAEAQKTESGWFDMDGCDFCKNWLEDPELMHHVRWESHKISDGAVTVTVVPSEFKEAHAKAAKAAEALGAKMMNGEVNPMTVSMCGHCSMFGQLLMAGASMERSHGESADIDVITSSDPEVVKMIHTLVDRNLEEHAEFEKLMRHARHHDHGHHHGHDHAH